MHALGYIHTPLALATGLKRTGTEVHVLRTVSSSMFLLPASKSRWRVAILVWVIQETLLYRIVESEECMDNTIPPPGLQPSYNSGSTEPIRKIDAPFDSGGTILSAVSKMVAVGDLGDLQRSRGQLSLLQPSYNSGSTVPIATSSTSFDSAYAISSAVSKLVTLGDLCDLKMALRHFCLQQYCSHPITQNLLYLSRRARRHSIQHMRFHQPFQSW